jgi:hypothetical protein
MEWTGSKSRDDEQRTREAQRVFAGEEGHNTNVHERSLIVRNVCSLEHVGLIQVLAERADGADDRARVEISMRRRRIRRLRWRWGQRGVTLPKIPIGPAIRLSSKDDGRVELSVAVHDVFLAAMAGKEDIVAVGEEGDGVVGEGEEVVVVEADAEAEATPGARVPDDGVRDFVALEGEGEAVEAGAAARAH